LPPVARGLCVGPDAWPLDSLALIVYKC